MSAPSNERTVKVPAILSSYRLLKDGGVSVGFSTQELTDEEKLVLGSFYQKFGALAFRENELRPEDIPNEDVEFEGKSPSKRLRAVLFVLWKQRGAKGGFEDYYRQKVDGIVEQIKEKLDK